MSVCVPVEETTSQPHQPLTGRQRKRWKQRQHLKELKRQNAYDKDKSGQYEESDYYFENGLRKVYPYHFTFTTCVQESWTGRPILEVFAEQFQSNTRDNYKKAIEAGDLRVNGEPVSVDYSLKTNDIIISRIHRHENPVADEELEVLHEDKDVLVVNKPASIPSQPCGRYRFNSVVFILCKELGLPMLRNVYRLDWQTSGVMVCGKTKEKSMILEHQIQNGFVTKEYVARVHGEFPLGEVTLDQPIGCMSHRLFLWKVTPNGKPSKTKFERMSYNGSSSVVKCIPLEVRMAHHIRVHLQYLGHPIMNDPVYNSDVWGPTKGKAGVYTRPDTEVIEDVVAIHTVGQWTEERNPILDLKHNKASISHSVQSSNIKCRSVDDSSKDSHCESYSTSGKSVKFDNESLTGQSGGVCGMEQDETQLNPKPPVDDSYTNLSQSQSSTCNQDSVLGTPKESLHNLANFNKESESSMDRLKTVLDRPDKTSSESTDIQRSSQMVLNESCESKGNEYVKPVEIESMEINVSFESAGNLSDENNRPLGHVSKTGENVSIPNEVSQIADTVLPRVNQKSPARICTCPCTCGARTVELKMQSAKLSNSQQDLQYNPKDTASTQRTIKSVQSQLVVVTGKQTLNPVMSQNKETVTQKPKLETFPNKNGTCIERVISSPLSTTLEPQSQVRRQTPKKSSEAMKRNIVKKFNSSEDDGAKGLSCGAKKSTNQDVVKITPGTDCDEPITKRPKNDSKTDKIQQNLLTDDPEHEMNVDTTNKATNSLHKEIPLKINRATSVSPTSTKSTSSRHLFNIDKWIPDPHCAECAKKYVDPDPQRLRIYLHALRYKGPGWEYSTKLPPWAEEDWNKG